MKKMTISLRIPKELNEFIDMLAKDKFTTKTQILLDFIVENYKDYKKNEKNNSKKVSK